MDRRFEIRLAAADEMQAVAMLFQEYADTLGVDLAYQGFEAEVAALPGAYGPRGGTLLLAVSADRTPVGCVGVRPLAEPATCEMKRLYTSRHVRGMGIGRALAAAAIEAAIQIGYHGMRLDTLPTMAAAQALYRGLGFQNTSRYYDTPVAGTVFMRKTLVRR
jgi:ribosomal protein S18 acetylase RimI-like enzyme